MNATKINRLERELRNFARMQDHNVRGGSLSPHDAALFVRSYGQGMAETAMRVLGLDEPPPTLVATVRAETHKFDKNAVSATQRSGRRWRSA